MAIPNTKGSELGRFLRSRREMLTATDPRLPSGRKRRGRGLRREEVALLAGIGVEWYIRLEQGRAVRPSTSTVEALARALRLTKVDHARLVALAQRPTARDSRRALFMRETVPPNMSVVLNNLHQPAYIIGRRFDVLAWNTEANTLFSFSQCSESERNMLLYMLLDTSIRRLFGGAWSLEAQRMVAEFRSTYDHWIGDPSFLEILNRLRDKSPEFGPWWNAHNHRNPAAERKARISPKSTEFPFDYASFQSNDTPALRLVVYGNGVTTQKD